MGQIFQKPEYAGVSPGTTLDNYLKNDDDTGCEQLISNSNQYNRIVSEPIDIPIPPINKKNKQTYRTNTQIRTI